MRRTEEIYREILFQSVENKKRTLTQSELASGLNVSLSVVNLALKPLKRMNAISVKKRGFDIIDSKKILFYWASIRNLEKDIIYKIRVDKPVRKIESEMPSGIVYTACSAYKFFFKDVPADYSEVYVYSDDIKEIEKRFPQNSNAPNLFVLKKDKNMKKITLAQMFVDLWNMKEWYAKDFLKALEVHLNGILE
ncbi:MAG: hypothetical protein V1740_06575 [Candidatus Woesearchaeota archaeon]